jgi:activator of 2-hydroxyglutaryl-CoA dehydratase/predicted nucleotide-binding protein (sugar kinase/HSP70/actin superfamily)
MKSSPNFIQSGGRVLLKPHTINIESLTESTTKRKIFIDAGIENIRVWIYDRFTKNDSEILSDTLVISNNDDLRKLFRESGLIELFFNADGSLKNGIESIYITGKLADITRKVLGLGKPVLPAAVLWSAANSFLHQNENRKKETIGIIDLSASGYMVICIDENARLKDDLLIVNPRCGAGTGINLSRILHKLNISRNDVDDLLDDYLGERGREKRDQVPVRSDRCGVFSSSATISDKNQGIPLEYALAITMKSEVMKPCLKMPSGIDKVYLSGGVFRWQYARNCAEDILKSNGVGEVVYDHERSISIAGMKHLAEGIGPGKDRNQNTVRLRKPDTLFEFPSFKSLKEKYRERGLYKRLPNPEIELLSPGMIMNLPVNIGLDIGSIMAKIVVSDAVTGKLLFHNFYDNQGDTIDTIKHIFRKFRSAGIDKLRIQNIGITGSGRYQVRKVLGSLYPHIKERISVEVENYVHARGSIRLAKDHIGRLKRKGIDDVNEDFFMLIDIGGEDTKISVISLEKEELFDNAMNIKCSAGTGSLMDTLKALFDIEEIADAYSKAFEAGKAYGFNATCAVFLMENARKMQAEGYGKDEILASCCYAIVENMARSLWNQVELPRNTIVLLHGQTMLSDPLPLAVTHRLQEYMGSDTYCLVPPFPGHRACFGLLRGMEYNSLPAVEEYCHLDDLIEREFQKKIILCRGTACGDKNARCVRTKLHSEGIHGKIALTLGGCTTINELEARIIREKKNDTPDAYAAIWNFIDGKLPKSGDKNRLVIPRSFAVSEKAFFFGKMLEQLGIPVHTDNVQERDILEGQPLFSIDTCAPNIGAAGQFLRLAREAHGIILVPQIDFLPVEGESIGRTCTTNQGGVFIARHFAISKYPEARFKLFDISLNKTDPQHIADQLYDEFHELFEYYEVTVSKRGFIEAITYAAKAYEKLNKEVAGLTADIIEEAISKKLNISLICAREYILNPGIYDSHIGKLLNDKGIVAIPAWVLETYPDERFDFIYWKNPHDLTTKINAISEKKLHRIIKNRRLKGLIREIETGNAEILMSVVMVSTFRCGPDSITLPLLAEITRNIPTLLIQSDAIIAELAHLENRVKTHLNQLDKNLYREVNPKKAVNPSTDFLTKFQLDELHHETDVIYFPTMHDNRVIGSVFRAAGLTVIDNFNDDSYDLEEKVKSGKKYVGDSVCAPLAAVFSDMVSAIIDFKTKKEINDPLVRGKERVVLFIHSGDGPCRQGQYMNICQLSLQKVLEDSINQSSELRDVDFPVKFLVNFATELDDSDDYVSEIEEWTTVQGFHAIIAKGVLHSIYLKAYSNCSNHEELEKLNDDYRILKHAVYDLLEQKVKPGTFNRFMVDKIERYIPKLGGIARYFGYGLYNNNGIRRILKDFNRTWIKKAINDPDLKTRKVTIHVDGEVYLRVTQLEEILKSLTDNIGFNSFNLTYTPLWSYFEYLLESRIKFTSKDIEKHENKLQHTDEKTERRNLSKLIREKEDLIKESTLTIKNLRNILAKPLYNAAGLEMPDTMKRIIAEAEPVLPTFKPCGELVPYVGETISRLNNGTDLVLNVAPEGCMVSSMGTILSTKMLQSVKNNNAFIQHLFSTEGELDEELLRLSLLIILGPENYYSYNSSIKSISS